MNQKLPPTRYAQEDLPDMARKVLGTHAAAKVFLLEGELGAGKTALVQAMTQQLGYEGVVASPTFGLVNEYPTPTGRLVHMDLYRLSSDEELLHAGILEYLESGDVCFIEWPAPILPWVPEGTVHIYIAHDGADARQLHTEVYI
jgi:tRNA threonylcarbamoyladenosine biosynthesis protein TsaE